MGSWCERLGKPLGKPASESLRSISWRGSILPGDNIILAPTPHSGPPALGGGRAGGRSRQELVDKVEVDSRLRSSPPCGTLRPIRWRS